jgi:uncharacterized protein (TIGR02246 family)
MPSSVRNGILLTLLLLSSVLLGQDREQPATKAEAKVTAGGSGDESMIRANVDAFVKAYNAGDAKAIGKLFVSDAQMVDEDGTSYHGRDAIEKMFAAIHADAPDGRIRVDVETLRFFGPALAIETGRSKATSELGDPPDLSRYTVVHTKSPDGKWQMAFVRDIEAPELPGYDQLQSLEWLVGDWVDESADSIVRTSCKWSDNKNFLLQDAEIRTRGADTMHLSQRIGWDPLTKQVKSWLFDSDGGYGESYWTHDGDHWIVKATAVRKDGTTGSMTNIYTPKGKDAYTWRTTDRIIGGEILPPLEVRVVRKPPEAVLSK